MQFLINSDDVLKELVKYVNSQRDKGVTPFVEVGNKKDVRRNAQNRTMHMWFKEISEQTGNGLIYESGRCKISYFLPVMRQSKSSKTTDQIEVLEWIWKSKESTIFSETGARGGGYEFLAMLLGNSHIESTRLLTVEEFATAMNNMQEAERNNGIILTNPEKYGWEIWRK